MDVTSQTVLLAIATTAAMAWILVVAATALLGMRTRAGDDADAVVNYAARTERLSRFVALPASLVAGGAAIAGWRMADPALSIGSNWWIGTAIGAWIVAFFGSSLLRAPQLARAVAIAGDAGADDEDVQWRIRQVDLTSRGELVLLLVAVVVLVVRPA